MTEGMRIGGEGKRGRGRERTRKTAEDERNKTGQRRTGRGS
jgi:hypothetical protein